MFKWLLILMTLSTSPIVSADNVESPFDCTIAMQSPQQLSKGVWLNFAINNNLNHQVMLLAWYTPLEGFLSKLFIITDSNGKQLPYQGPMVKRAEPDTNDFYPLNAHGRLDTSIDLSAAYAFTPGEYVVELAINTLHFKDPSLVTREFQCPCNRILVRIE